MSSKKGLIFKCNIYFVKFVPHYMLNVSCICLVEIYLLILAAKKYYRTYCIRIILKYT
jgi:hypothetical protein